MFLFRSYLRIPTPVLLPHVMEGYLRAEVICVIRPRQLLRKPLSIFFFIFIRSQTILRQYVTKSRNKPIAHNNQPARGLGLSHLQFLGSLGSWWRLWCLIISHALPSRAKVGHFLRLSGGTFLSSQARQASLRLDMHNFQRNQQSIDFRSERHPAQPRLHNLQYNTPHFGIATTPDWKIRYRAESCVMMIYQFRILIQDLAQNTERLFGHALR